MLLDTNIISAIMLPTPHPNVVDWLRQQDADRIYISSVTVAEVHYGLECLPDGKRRRALQERFDRFLTLGFHDRTLSFDLVAAQHYGKILGHRRAIGRPLGMADGQIAAIARANALAVVTRNEKDFTECGLEVVNPY
jgi:predicted nucleic acid-binding protein